VSFQRRDNGNAFATFELAPIESLFGFVHLPAVFSLFAVLGKAGVCVCPFCVCFWVGVVALPSPVDCAGVLSFVYRSPWMDSWCCVCDPVLRVSVLSAG